jgi:hypothetical protein
MFNLHVSALFLSLPEYFFLEENDSVHLTYFVPDARLKEAVSYSKNQTDPGEVERAEFSA